MMDAIQMWFIHIVATTVLLSVVQIFVSGNSLRKLFSFLGGLTLLLVMLRPLLLIREQDFQIKLEQYEAAIASRQAELETEQTESWASRIAEETGAYILDKANQIHIPVQVSVETEQSADGIPIPVQVVLTGQRSEELSAWIAETLGIPAERQVWNEQESKN